MDFNKDIYLNTDKIYENSSLIILYNGILSKSPNNKVYLHYGYNDTWDNSDEMKLKRTDSGMLGVLRISSGNSFQFAFRDDNNCWDNNNNANYILPILEKEDTVLEFGPDEISKDTLSENTEDTSVLETSVYSSDDFEFENTYTVSTSSIPYNTVVNKLEFDDFTNTYFIKPQVIGKTLVSELELEESFTTFSTEEAKEVSVTSEEIINPAIPRITEEATSEEKSTTAMVPAKENKPTIKSSFYMLKKRLKLAFLKLGKLIRTALNYNENNN